SAGNLFYMPRLASPLNNRVVIFFNCLIVVHFIFHSTLLFTGIGTTILPPVFCVIYFIAYPILRIVSLFLHIVCEIVHLTPPIYLLYTPYYRSDCLIGQ